MSSGVVHHLIPWVSINQTHRNWHGSVTETRKEIVPTTTQPCTCSMLTCWKWCSPASGLWTWLFLCVRKPCFCNGNKHNDTTINKILDKHICRGVGRIPDSTQASSVMASNMLIQSAHATTQTWIFRVLCWQLQHEFKATALNLQLQCYSPTPSTMSESTFHVNSARSVCSRVKVRTLSSLTTVWDSSTDSLKKVWCFLTVIQDMLALRSIGDTTRSSRCTSDKAYGAPIYDMICGVHCCVKLDMMLRIPHLVWIIVSSNIIICRT